MSHDITPNSIETAGGHWVDVTDPVNSNITLDDIAHGCAATCRYSGHVRRGYYDDGSPIPVHYSVAEHAVYVSVLLERWGYPWEVQYAGLHHDDAESFLNDIPRPQKKLYQPAFGLLEELMDAAVAHSLRAPWLVEAMHRPEVKAADSYMLLLEASELMPSGGKNWAAVAEQWEGVVNFEAFNADDPLPDFWLGQKGNKIELVGRTAKDFYLEREKELVNR